MEKLINYLFLSLFYLTFIYKSTKSMSELFTGVKREFYKNGQLEFEIFMCNGVKEGEYKQFYENGQLRVHCFYVNGKLEGEYKKFDEDGQLKIQCFYVNGKKVD